MDRTAVALKEISDWDDGEPPDIDEIRYPLTMWTDPAAPADGVGERHIVRSID